MLYSLIQFVSPIDFIFIPGFILIAVFLLYKTVIKKEKPAGIVLYLGLLITLDVYLWKGIPIPGFEIGTVRYSELFWLILFFQDRQLRLTNKNEMIRKITFCFFLYIIFMFVSVLGSKYFVWGIASFRVQIIPQILAFTIGISGLEKEEDYIKFFNYMVLLVLVIAIFNIWMEYANKIIFKGQLIDSHTVIKALEHRRYGSLFGNPNYLGLFVVLLLPVYTMMAISTKKYNYIYFIVVGILIFILAQTRSRGPIIACGAAMLVLSLTQLRKYPKLIGFITAFIIIFTLIAPDVKWKIFRRFETEGAFSELGPKQYGEYGRIERWIITLNVIKENPFGIGFRGDFWEKEAARGVGFFDNPHNSYLEVALYGGLQALLLILIILIIFFKSNYNIIKLGNNPILSGIYFAIFGYAIGMIVEPVMFRPRVANIFWILLTFGICMNKRKTKIEEKLTLK